MPYDDLNGSNGRSNPFNRYGQDSLLGDTRWKLASEEVFNEYRKEVSGSTVKSINGNILDASPIADRYDKGYFTKFKRLPILDPFNHYDGAVEYLFFTRPDLCICQAQSGSLNSSLSGNAIFEYALSCYPELIAGLQSSASISGAKSACRFIPFLSNAASSSLDLPDLDSDDIESPQNIYGTKIFYRGTSAGSNKNYEFNIEFEDTKQSEIYMFFKLWDTYKQLDWAGDIDISAPDCAHWEDYIAYKVLFDQITIFKIIVAADGYTILFWAEIVGCYPKGVPRSVWNDPNNLNNYMKITTNWKGQFLRDSDPNSLAHFNKIATGNPDTRIKRNDMPIYNEGTKEMYRVWPARPYIYLPTSLGIKGKRHPYQLRWSIN